MGRSKRPDGARLEDPLAVNPGFEYVGGLRRSSRGTSMSVKTS